MSTVPDAIWYVEFSTAAVEIPTDLTHPQNIRQWHRNPTAAVDIDADDSSPWDTDSELDAAP
jgi:hypothetical protein